MAFVTRSTTFLHVHVEYMSYNVRLLLVFSNNDTRHPFALDLGNVSVVRRGFWEPPGTGAGLVHCRGYNHILHVVMPAEPPLPRFGIAVTRRISY